MPSASGSRASPRERWPSSNAAHARRRSFQRGRRASCRRRTSDTCAPSCSTTWAATTRRCAWYGTFGENSPYDLVYLAPSLYRQAQIYDARRQKAQAIERYKRFVELWKNCDPQLQSFTTNAKMRIARLQ